MTGIAVIGAGVIGSIHARNVARHRECELIYVADVDAPKAQRLAAECSAAATDTDVEAVLADDRVDGVIIASSTSAHERHVLDAARAGKAMLVEKPLADELDKARACLRVVEESGVVAAMGFNRRLDASHRAVHDAAEAGEIGAIEILHLTSRTQAPPDPTTVPASGGMLREKGAHFFDLACWIARAEPVEVFTAGACLIDPRLAEYGDVDTAVLTVRLASGAIAGFDFSRRTSYGYDERIEVHGAEGMLESRRPRRRDVSLYKGDRIIDDGLHPGWFERFEPTYRDELDAFVGALRGDRTPHATLRDGYRAQAVSEAAIRSMVESRPVRIDSLSHRSPGSLE